MMNVINGGAHAANSTDIQEFMIMPAGFDTFSRALQAGVEVFHTLSKVLKEKGFATTVGDEGGFPLSFTSTEKASNAKALEILSEAVQKAGYTIGQDIFFALDLASSEFYSDGIYKLKVEGKSLSSSEMVNYIVDLTNKYPIISVEDGMAESDWDGWQRLTRTIGSKIQLVGDDLLVTNTKFIQKGITQVAANAVLIKLNQIGSLSETIAAVKLAQSAHWNCIISHRSGETEDTTIADLAVGLGTGQIKTGSLSRTDRVAKYNRLLRIEELLGTKATYHGQVKTQSKLRD